MTNAWRSDSCCCNCCWLLFVSFLYLLRCKTGAWSGSAARCDSQICQVYRWIMHCISGFFHLSCHISRQCLVMANPHESTTISLTISSLWFAINYRGFISMDVPLSIIFAQRSCRSWEPNFDCLILVSWPPENCSWCSLKTGDELAVAWRLLNWSHAFPERNTGLSSRPTIVGHHKAGFPALAFFLVLPSKPNVTLSVTGKAKHALSAQPVGIIPD